MLIFVPGNDLIKYRCGDQTKGAGMKDRVRGVTKRPREARWEYCTDKWYQVM